MISVEELNKHTYPKTVFFLDKADCLWLDLNIELNKKKLPPIKLGDMEEISSPNREIRPIFETKQLDSIFNFLTTTLQEKISQIDNQIREHIRQYPNAQSFKNMLPPEVKTGYIKENGDLTINSDNNVVLQNMGPLNRYLFNFITDIATGKIDIKERVSDEALIKILNKRHFLKINKKRENQDVLRIETMFLAKGFNKKLDDLVKNERFLTFIRDNKIPLSDIINMPNKNRAKLIELADERLSGRKDLKKQRNDVHKMSKDYVIFIANDVLSLALNNVNRKKKNQELSSVLASLIANKKQKQ